MLDLVKLTFLNYYFLRFHDGFSWLNLAIAQDKVAKKCNTNEVYTTCGTACPLTCDNYENPPEFCTQQCIIGCVCASGYVKNSDGKCVLPTECKPKGNSHL